MSPSLPRSQEHQFEGTSVIFASVRTFHEDTSGPHRGAEAVPPGPRSVPGDLRRGPKNADARLSRRKRITTSRGNWRQTGELQTAPGISQTRRAYSRSSRSAIRQAASMLAQLYFNMGVSGKDGTRRRSRGAKAARAGLRTLCARLRARIDLKAAGMLRPSGKHLSRWLRLLARCRGGSATDLDLRLSPPPPGDDPLEARRSVVGDDVVGAIERRRRRIWANAPARVVGSPLLFQAPDPLILRQ